MLEIVRQDLPRCNIVRAKGRIDSESVNQLKEAFEAITAAGRYKIVFNMAEVSFMSSAGLTQLIETMKVCKHLNRGNLVLTNLSPNLKDVLDLTGLTAIFTLYNTEVEGVGNF